MSQQPGTFDPHAAIKELAEATGPCPNTAERGKAHFGPTCIFCGGTGRIVLFPSLRVKCVIGEHHDGRGEAWHGHYPEVHKDADCPGWVPVSDVRVACYELLANEEVAKNVWYVSAKQRWCWYDTKGIPNHKGWTPADTREEAVIRAAQEGVKEQP